MTVGNKLCGFGFISDVGYCCCVNFSLVFSMICIDFVHLTPFLIRLFLHVVHLWTFWEPAAFWRCMRNIFLVLYKDHRMWNISVSAGEILGSGKANVAARDCSGGILQAMPTATSDQVNPFDYCNTCSLVKIVYFNCQRLNKFVI